MVFSILPILLIVIGLGIAVMIVVRKFPQLKSLDTEQLPEEQDRRKKNKLIEERFYRAIDPKMKKVGKVGKKVLAFLMNKQRGFRSYVNTVADSYRSEHGKVRKKKFKSKSTTERKTEVKRLLHSADALRKEKDYVHAEEKYIAAIGLAPRNAIAYKGLGKVYFAQEKLDEARETFGYLTKVSADDPIGHAFLGRIAKEQKKWSVAVKHYKKALELDDGLGKRFIDLAQVYTQMDGKVKEAKAAYKKAYELEPKNPAVIDQIIEYALDIKDKKLAKIMIAQLQAVNPENKKLDGFKKELRELR